MTACLLSQAISTTKYDHLLKAVKVHFPADSQTASSQQHPHLYFPLFTTVIFISAASPTVVTATCCHLTLISFAILHDFTQHAEDCAPVHTLYLFIHLFIQWNISSLTWFFFLKPGRKSHFYFIFYHQPFKAGFSNMRTLQVIEILLQFQHCYSQQEGQERWHWRACWNTKEWCDLPI